jgi:hypothetical protein
MSTESIPKLKPRPWRFSSEPCPRVVAVTLHLPWIWSFFPPLVPGEPEEQRRRRRKDVENRKDGFPALPPGTILALHNGGHYDAKAEAFINGLLPECVALTRRSCPRGALMGAVVVEETTKGELFLPRKSPWYLGWGCAVWLKPERWLFPEPVPFCAGWFGAWVLPPELEKQVLLLVEKTPPFGA